ncbi:MAG: hypothetical protein KBD01_18830, partial [Acidobacteria bacterium]|nr:hypothetical protein [Acidobacteriota bacterium]
LQPAAAGLACHFRVPLSRQEQTDLQQVTHIPAGDYPHAVVAIGGIPSPIDLRVSKEAGQTRLDWNGGTPPYRILRSESSDFSDPIVLEDAWPENHYIDLGTLTDGNNYFYDVR